VGKKRRWKRLRTKATQNRPIDRSAWKPEQPLMAETPIRAVFVIQKLAGLTGGAERVFLETCQAMVARGIHVRVLTFDPRSAAAGYDAAGLEIINLFPFPRVPTRQMSADGGKAGRLERWFKRIPNVFPVGQLKWQATHGLFARLIRREISAFKADCIVAFLPPAIAAAGAAVQGTDCALIASTHNVPEQDFGLNSARWDQNPVYRHKALNALNRAWRVTILQEAFADWFPAERQAALVRLANPVGRLSEPKGATLRQPIILAVGRLAAVKRHEMLIDAFALIADDLPGWSVQIWGEGPQEAFLRHRIAALQLETRIILAGVTQAIGSEYDNASILAHPSAFEGFGLSVAEAMAHGLPPVAFNSCAGVNQLVRHGENGLLVDDRLDPVKALAEGLKLLANDAALRARLGQAAEAIVKRFDRETIHDQWAALLAAARDASKASPIFGDMTSSNHNPGRGADQP
jgi:glycosyltransferase involved in cell wall biosynthesis